MEAAQVKCHSDRDTNYDTKRFIEEAVLVT